MGEQGAAKPEGWEFVERTFPGYAAKPFRPRDQISPGLRIYFVEHVERKDESGRWLRVFEDHFLVPGESGWVLLVVRFSIGGSDPTRPGLRELYCRLPPEAAQPYEEDQWLYRTPTGPGVPPGTTPETGDVARLERAFAELGHPAVSGQRLYMVIKYVLLLAPQMSERTGEAMNSAKYVEELID
mmetsp:Transcript_100892/g.300969  ORF Transcript_100892/g.300969 Transcript_100892/m.300969 type:complete len:184 (-) Transcript_100892:75-626(-)